jgi:hypothetical protein
MAASFCLLRPPANKHAAACVERLVKPEAARLLRQASPVLLHREHQLAWLLAVADRRAPKMAFIPRPTGLGGVPPPNMFMAMQMGARPPFRGPRPPHRLPPGPVGVDDPSAATGPPVTVFVGNITERAQDAMVRHMLTMCGPVLSWKRVQGATGRLQVRARLWDFEDALLLRSWRYHTTS